MTVHGTLNAFTLGCRCDLCADVKDGVKRRQPWTLYRPVERRDLQGCGTPAAYSRGCRCDDCRRAAAARRSVLRGGPRPRQLEPCPSFAAYRRGCRCDGCRQASGEYRRRYRRTAA